MGSSATVLAASATGWLASGQTAWTEMRWQSISAAAWERARRLLVLYFSRRFCGGYAEDLAQETLASICGRGDYAFEKEEDFLCVCYGFARRILRKGYRDALKHAAEELDGSLAAPAHEAGGAVSAEMRVLLAQVCRIGASELHESEWRLIRNAAASGCAGENKVSDLSDANRTRVRLYRARRKLARLSGWKKQEANES
jgi:hypothetical protein